MATHSSILAWKSPWTEEPGGLKSMGLHDRACVHEGGGRWVGSNKVVEPKKKKKKKMGVGGCSLVLIVTFPQTPPPGLGAKAGRERKHRSAMGRGELRAVCLI